MRSGAEAGEVGQCTGVARGPYPSIELVHGIVGNPGVIYNDMSTTATQQEGREDKEGDVNQVKSGARLSAPGNLQRAVRATTMQQPGGKLGGSIQRGNPGSGAENGRRP